MPLRLARPFEDRLQATREQRAYQRAVASCDDPTATASDSASYPAGRVRALVDPFALECGCAPHAALPPSRRSTADEKPYPGFDVPLSPFRLIAREACSVWRAQVSREHSQGPRTPRCCRRYTTRDILGLSSGAGARRSG